VIRLTCPNVREALTNNFNRAERHAVGLTQPEGETGGDGRRSSAGEIHGLIPFIAIYIIDLEHLCEVSDFLENGMINFSKKRVEVGLSPTPFSPPSLTAFCSSPGLNLLRVD